MSESVKIPRVLSIAGTDPTGGAGIHADLKSIGALGGYGMAVVTALVAQNTTGVRSVSVPPVDFLEQQLNAVSDDVTIDAVKIGMLQSEEIISTVNVWLDKVRPPIVVLDPVMVATSGDRLLSSGAENQLRDLCKRVNLITPNIPELSVLTGKEIAETWDEACAQATWLAKNAGTRVLLKGGHLNETIARDAIVDGAMVTEIASKRFATKNTHGTGCSLSSAIATLKAKGLSWEEALEQAKAWLQGAIAWADELQVGEGNGPVDHFWILRHEGLPQDALPHADAVSEPKEISWSQNAWQQTAFLRNASEQSEFVSGLRSGAVPLEVFHWYLAQDAIYLQAYSEVMETVAALAPNAVEREFWLQRAQGALVVEAALHRSRIGDAEPEPYVVTAAYIGHLQSAVSRNSYSVAVAAVLPCFWLYADIGTRMAAYNHDVHPYRDWLAAYSDQVFMDWTNQVIELANRAALTAPVAEKAQMDQAFKESMLHEFHFFTAPTVLGRVQTLAE